MEEARIKNHDDSSANQMAVDPGSRSNQTACSPRPTPDKRILRTQRALRSALIELVNECGYDGFTVNDLCKRADINRGTFYNHYHDKEEFIRSCEDEVLEGFERFQPRINDMSMLMIVSYDKIRKPMPLLVEVFEYLQEQCAFVQAMLGTRGDSSFSTRIVDTFCNRMMRSVLHEKYRKNPTTFVDYYVSFYSSALLGIINEWYSRDMQESPEEMAVITARLLLNKVGDPIKL